jgi:aspartate racemase
MNTLPYSLKKHTERKSIIIGVIGGAGPDAAINFQIKLSNAMKRILKAKTDAEHYRVLVDNNTQVNEQHSCSMEEKLLHQGYLQSAFLLKKMGANIITIPCNSAHAYYEEIKEEAFPALLVNMIDETCHFLVNSLLNYRNSIGLLAVPETINKNIYHAPLKKHEFYPIVPGSEIQKKFFRQSWQLNLEFIMKNFILNVTLIINLKKFLMLLL